MKAFLRLELGCVVVALFAAAITACSGDDTEPASPTGDAGAGDATFGGDSSLQDSASDAPASSQNDGEAGAPNDGGADASDAPVTPPVDAGVCVTWRYANPVVLDALSLDGGPGPAFTSGVWVVSTAADRVRVLAQAGGGPVFRVYGYDKTTSVATALDGPTIAGADIADAHHFVLASSSVTQVVVQTSSGSSDTTQISAYLLDDTLPPATGPVPSPIAVSPGYGGVTAIPFDESTVFDAVRYLESTSGATIYYGLGVGLATSSAEATLANVSISTNSDDFGFLAAAHANGNVYVFASNAASVLGESVFTVPDTAVVPSEATPRAFSSGDDGRMIDVAPGVASATTNAAYWSQASNGSSSTLRAGQLANAQLDTATASDLAVVLSSSDVALSNATLTAQWQGDHMMIIGPSETHLGDGGTPPGAQAVWIDALHGLRAAQVGSGALLQDRSGMRIAAASPSSIGATQAAWDVAWIETHADGTESLLYNELDCE